MYGGVGDRRAETQEKQLRPLRSRSSLRVIPGVFGVGCRRKYVIDGRGTVMGGIRGQRTGIASIEAC
jgi:hypothetical protein